MPTPKPILFLVAMLLTACGPTPQKQTRTEITGTQSERITRATAILAKYGTLPGPLLDAHMAEDLADNSGGMVPGPSDSYLSGVITCRSMSGRRMGVATARPSPSAWQHTQTCEHPDSRAVCRSSV